MYYPYEYYKPIVLNRELFVSLYRSFHFVVPPYLNSQSLLSEKKNQDLKNQPLPKILIH